MLRSCLRWIMHPKSIPKNTFNFKCKIFISLGAIYFVTISLPLIAGGSSSLFQFLCQSRRERLQPLCAYKTAIFSYEIITHHPLILRAATNDAVAVAAFVTIHSQPCHVHCFTCFVAPSPTEFIACSSITCDKPKK